MVSGLPLALTMGDPAGVGPICSVLAWQGRAALGLPAFFVIASKGVIDQAFTALRLASSVKVISDPEDALAAFSDYLPVIETGGKPVPFGSPDIESAPAILASIETGVRFALEGRAGGVVTNPISKAVLYAAGFAHPGHTEFLAHLCTRPDGAEPLPVMMLAGGGLRVSLATIHMPLRQVPDSLSGTLLERIGAITLDSLKRDFAIPSPRLGIAGLNPHAGETGTIGLEEEQIINPAAARLRARGYDASDARPGDTIFHEAREGRYDAVMAMYHDQGLIPVKTLDVWGGVNITLGLPIIRTSPDHGTAYDAARSGTVRPESLVAALRMARQMAQNRATTA